VSGMMLTCMKCRRLVLTWHAAFESAAATHKQQLSLPDGGPIHEKGSDNAMGKLKHLAGSFVIFSCGTAQAGSMWHSGLHECVSARLHPKQ
jgi:hypothetical protein